MAGGNCYSTFCSKVVELKPVMLMLLVQVGFATMNVLYKLAVNDGMSMKVLIAYRYIFAFVFITPIAYFVERKSRPKLTWMVVLQGFFCGLFGGSFGQNLYLESMNMTSATFASAMTNLIPPITFILAVIFRYEKLRIRSIIGQTKVLGTCIGIGGAMLLTFYKGVEIPIPSSNVFHIKKVHKDVDGHNQIFGALLSLASCLCYSSWLMIQAKMGEKYPCYYSITSIMCGFSAIQSIIYSMSMEKDWSQWKLGWNVRLLSVMFSGIVASGVSLTLMGWCVQLRGPLFVSIFNPVMLILVALAGCILLNEKLYLGSIFGVVLIIIGLYAVLWGKDKEMKMTQLVLSSGLHEEPDEITDVVIRSESVNSRHSFSVTDFPYSYPLPLESEAEITMKHCSSINKIKQNQKNVKKRDQKEDILKKTLSSN